MAAVPTLDMHPEFFPSSKGPDTALAACRRFLLEQWEAGRKEARLVTGLGLHGDGTPRLRLRVEREILPAFHDQVEHVELEQGGAVLRVIFKKRPQPGGDRQDSHVRKEAAQRRFVFEQERLMVARQRVEQAWACLDEDDLRRARLKVNQLLREFGLPLAGEGLEAVRKGLETAEATLKKMDES